MSYLNSNIVLTYCAAFHEQLLGEDILCAEIGRLHGRNRIATHGDDHGRHRGCPRAEAGPLSHRRGTE